MPKERPAPLASTSASTTPSGKPVPPRQRKIAILGSRSVGKSSLTLQFCDNHFVESYYPTIEESFTKEFTYKNKQYVLEIQDTAGHDEFSLLNAKYAVGWHGERNPPSRQWYGSADMADVEYHTRSGYILVYSIASKASFEMIPIIREKILSYSGVDKVPMCIVGNKSDLNVQRVVKTEDGEALARSLGCAFTEASAKHNDNVQNAFQLLVKEIEGDLNPESAKSTTGQKESWGTWFKGVFGGSSNSQQ
ncbi:GTP-binding protein [Cystobasidiomycetes sp. EMM_F5]